MKKILLIALVSTVGITAQASVLQAPAKNKNVPKSEVAEPKTLPAKAACILSFFYIPRNRYFQFFGMNLVLTDGILLKIL